MVPIGRLKLNPAGGIWRQGWCELGQQAKAKPSLCFPRRSHPLFHSTPGRSLWVMLQEEGWCCREVLRAVCRAKHPLLSG